MYKKAIYRTDSDDEIYSSIVARVVFLLAITGALWHVKENPVALSIIAIVLILLFLFIGSESISVYNDRFIFDQGGIVRIFKKRIYYYKDIKEVTFEPISGLDLAVSNYFTKTPENSIQITFRNEHVETISTKLTRNEMDETLGIIDFELQRYLRK